jgi:hypothetical protein
MNRASVAVAIAALAALGREADAQHPAWAELEGMVVGGPVDAVFALGLECRPGGSPGGTIPPTAVAELLFGSVFPHPHHVDSASARALERGTVCAGRLWGDSATVLAFAMERRIVVLTVLFALNSSAAIPVADVRSRLRALWGRGNGPLQLEEWGGTRYRAYLMDGLGGDEARTRRRLTMYDVRACTAFEKLVHALGEPGAPLPC